MLVSLPCAAVLTHGKVPILCTQPCASTRQRTGAGNPNLYALPCVFLDAHGKLRAHGKGVDLISFRHPCPNRCSSYLLPRAATSSPQDPPPPSPPLSLPRSARRPAPPAATPRRPPAPAAPPRPPHPGEHLLQLPRRPPPL
jgi:hypothetical protein